MNPELKAKWVAALRSGEYKQGKLFLLTKDGKYCCLGVLVEVDKPGLLSTLDPGDLRTSEVHEYVECCPKSTDQWALARMNDEGKSFLEIAEYIAQRL